MYQILLIINLIVVIVMIGTILLQRSEGGALGIGGGGGGGGLMSGRGAGNALTKATAILAAIFMTTSMALTWLTRQDVAPTSILDSNPIAGEAGAPAADGEPIPPLVPLSE